MQVPMPVLECAACLRINVMPFLISTPVTLETPKVARQHFRDEHSDAISTDPDGCVVHVEFPDDDAPATFDLRPTRVTPGAPTR